MYLSSGEESDEENDAILFYVNKTGFPIANSIYKRMWDFACSRHPEGKVLADRCCASEVDVPIPKEPRHHTIRAPVKSKLKAIQLYMEALEYNHTGTQFFDIIKNRPLISLMEVARQMVTESLPIKCLEATILGLYLSNGIPGLERFPISFKSNFDGKTARHVVLGVYHCGMYGSLGLSRRSTLAYKPLKYETLSDLIDNFEASYAEVGHRINTLVIGIPVSHNPRSFESIVWRNFVVANYWKKQKPGVRVEIEKYAKEMRTKMKTSLPVVSSPATTGMPPVLTYNSPNGKSCVITTPCGGGGGGGTKSTARSRSSQLPHNMLPLRKSLSTDNLRSTFTPVAATANHSVNVAPVN